MSAQTVNQVIGRAVMDPEFRAQLLGDPAGALSGYDLSPDEHQQLSNLDASLLDSPEVQAQFNPKELTVDKPVPWQKHKNVEGDAPTLEFTAGEPKTLNVELMFDSYEDPPAVDPAHGHTPLVDAASLKVGGGEWDGDSHNKHPDFLWNPVAKPGSDPTIAHPKVDKTPHDLGTGQSSGKRRYKPIVIVGVILLIILALGPIVGSLIGSGIGGDPDRGARQPTEETTATVIDATQPPGDTPVLLVCGQTCTDGAACGQGLTCQASANGAQMCSRNGHCGCGVPCDPNAASACDPGLKCESQDGESVCWAGGCEPTQTVSQPTCQVIVGDGVCSACEDSQTDPTSCGGDQGAVCKCECKQVCNPNGLCQKVCRDCQGKKCSN